MINIDQPIQERITQCAENGGKKQQKKTKAQHAMTFQNKPQLLRQS